MAQVLITGGSGLIGRALTRHLQAMGHTVCWLGRSRSGGDNVKKFVWDPESGYMDTDALRDTEIIIHLAGENIGAKRWTDRRKKKILESRLKATEFLKRMLLETQHTVHTIIAASATGFYGNQPSPVDESAPAGAGFLAETTRQWELATAQLNMPGIRFVTVRIGIVLSPDGGAWPELMRTAWMRILPVLGSGKQVYSWIHIEDLLRIFSFVMERNVTGVVNAVSPAPLTQRELMKAVANVKRGPQLLFPVPAFALRIWFGEMGDVVLTGQNVTPAVLLQTGFNFNYANPMFAIRDLTKKVRTI